MATDYNKLKVTELKELLKERGIPQTGLSRKQQIVEALEKHDAEQGAGLPAADEAAVPEKGLELEDAHAVGETEDATESMKVEDATKPEAVEHDSKAEWKDEVKEEDDALPQAVVDQPVLQDSHGETNTAKTETTTPLPPSVEAKPIVLENNDPLSKEPSALNTPRRASPAADSVSSDTRKRKRRSPTPPLSQESVNKKLKAATDEANLIVKLPEDGTVHVAEEREILQDEPVAVERTAEAIKDGGTIPPSASSDNVMRMEEEEQRIEDSTAADIQVETMEVDEVNADSAIHSATRALYIRELVRPLNANQLRSHLLDLATPPNSSLDDSCIEHFHVDTIRTHAFVVFTSTAAAMRTRLSLHNRIWPNEPTRKSLWVDFVPEDKAVEWIETERQAEEGSGRATVRRWEIVYDEGENGVIARLEEASQAGSGLTRQGSTSSAVGQGMPNAPIGPRGSHRPSSPPRPSATPDMMKNSAPASAPPSASFNVLDERFRHTATKPKLYYLPKEVSIASSRLESLAAITSRNWDPQKEGSFFRSGDVRRYTFEDKDRVVDGGADIGNFGRPRGMELGPRGGRGGGRGGRW